MSVSVFAGRIGAALTVAIGAAKLAPLFVSNMFVLFAGAGRTVAVAGGIAEAAFCHYSVRNFVVSESEIIVRVLCDNRCRSG